MSLHTILGANGVIGRELSRELRQAGHRVRQVSRSPQPEHPDDEVRVADLLDPAATANAVAGSEVAYLVAGLKYDARVWQEQWPVIMRNTIDACIEHAVPLVFFDNVYGYGRVDGSMTEDTPYNPCSRKGEVRAQIATALMNDVQRGNVRAMIVRAADFYGPGATLSLTHATVVERLRAGKSPQWIGDAQAQHSLTFTPDAARTVARLATLPAAWGHVWHAVTSAEPMSGERFARVACEIAGRSYKLQVAPRWMLRLMGFVSPVLRENMEMLYQFEWPYTFDSRKTEAVTGLAATPYRDGIAVTLQN